MSPRFRSALSLLFASATAAWAQTAASAPSSPVAPDLPSTSAWPVATSAAAPAVFTVEQLDQLLAPIALYPDALLALLLPASTLSTDIVLAARFLQRGQNPASADNQPWDDSVRALVWFPDTVRWLDDNLAWTRQLGEAFSAQPTDVMAAVQRLRFRALAAGTLFSNAQQQVFVEGSSIQILPAQPDRIYVPTYNARTVYLARSTYSPMEATMPYFGLGFSMGPWLSYGLDWPRSRIWVINRHDRERYWRDHRASRPLPPPPVAAAAPGGPPPPSWHTWRPSPDRPRHASPPGSPNPSPPPAAPHPRPRLDFPRNDVARPATPPRSPRFENAPVPAAAFTGPVAAPTPPTGNAGAITAPSPTFTPPPAPAPRTRPPRDSLPTPPVGPPAPPAATPAPAQFTPVNRASDPAPRSRPVREDRPPDAARPPNAEPRTRSAPPPAAATPAPAATPGPRAAPATPPAPAPPTAPVESSDRRGKKSDLERE